MLDPERRRAIVDNCRRIAKPNGAWQAARLVAAAVVQRTGS
jgi:hypothetical protein